MLPTCFSGDLLMVDHKAYAKVSPDRFDLVLIRDPSEGRRILKRIVGIPNDRIAYEEGRLLINNRHCVEPYLRGLPASLGINSWRFDIDDDQYLILGDNRSRSTDGRRFGPIKSSSIIGKVWLRYWPIKSARLFD